MLEKALEELATREGFAGCPFKEWRGDIKKFVPTKSIHRGSLIYAKDEWTVYFIMPDGEVIKNPCKVAKYETSNYAGDEGYACEGETIGEALERYPARWVVLFHREILDRDGDYYHSEEVYIVDLESQGGEKEW
ncbi:MAG: hypothetical protein QXT58_05415 [Archaeoglobaceae archaeon]